jgi:hypothetical protein
MCPESLRDFCDWHFPGQLQNSNYLNKTDKYQTAAAGLRSLERVEIMKMPVG